MKEQLSENFGRRYRLDPRRRRTLSEIELVRAVFRCSETEARRILDSGTGPEEKAFIKGMLDAAFVESEIKAGKILSNPAWIIES